MIVFAHDVILILKLRHDPAVFKFNRGFFTPTEVIPQKRNTVILHYLALVRERRIYPERFAVIIIYRADKKRVVDVQDGRSPVKEL